LFQTKLTLAKAICKTCKTSRNTTIVLILVAHGLSLINVNSLDALNGATLQITKQVRPCQELNKNPILILI